MENSQKLIIGLTGQIACGKGVIKKHLIEKYGASDYRFSTILRDVLTRIDVEINRENLIKVSTALRQSFGEDTLAKAMGKDAEKDSHQFIVIDGVRRMADIKYLREVSGFILVRIVADQKTRYQRVVSRNENIGDDKKTFEDFLADEKAESEIEIPEVMSHANFEIKNDSSMEDLHANIDGLISATLIAR